MAKKQGVRCGLNLALFAAVALTLLALLVLTGVSYLYTGFFTRTPCVAPARTPDKVGISHFEQVAFPVPGGATARGWYISPAPDRQSVVILLPGLAGARDGMLDDAAILARRGYGLLMADPRACNQPGTRNSLGYHETADLLAAVEYLSGRPDRPDHIGVLGFSEGGVTAIRGAALDGRIDAVVAEGGFHDLAQHIWHGGDSPLARLVEWQVLFFYRLDTGVDPAAVSPVTDISRIGPRPLLLIYGEREAERGGASLLFNGAREPKDLWIVPGADHGGYIAAAPQEYERRVTAFFERAWNQALAEVR